MSVLGAEDLCVGVVDRVGVDLQRLGVALDVGDNTGVGGVFAAESRSERSGVGSWVRIM